MKTKKNIWKWIGIAFLAVLLVAAGGIWFIWGNELRSLMSIKQLSARNDEHLDGAVYEMKISGDYYFDEYLEQGGAANDTELLEFVTNKITKGLIPMTIEESDIACSSFTASTKDGDRLFGRNYDFSQTNTCPVFTDPGKGRHSSISTVDLQFLGIDEKNGVSSIMDRIKCLAAAYAPLDGINDAGVSCGIYMTYQGSGENAIGTDQNTDKPDLTSTTMLRMVLDYADSVDEAVEMIQKYDMHDSAGTSYHYMIADSTGKSAILEWTGDTDASDDDGSARELTVTYNDTDATSGASDYQYITNFIIKPDYYDNEEDMKGLDRYQRIGERLKEVEGVVADEEAAMDILAEVGRRTWKNDDNNGCTVHSAVYNLTDKSVLWVGNEHYGEDAYTFEYSLD
ncbi:linear amide C-N hydrolase [Parablautia sp. Marseille-Q6255]|uniref:linear amide C-N hydrolase n=1 Tax=Parablautia sp. Marseille-Q6255 TaxID=3039593 RepID=UPI0024BC1720|nr:linear amide C-N hydrolase [Parablautia sp. Marseille-Q6255]